MRRKLNRQTKPNNAVELADDLVNTMVDANGWETVRMIFIGELS